MPTPYGVLEKIKDHADYAHYAKMYELLNTPEGMKVCRALLRELGKKVNSGQELHEQLRIAEKDMLMLKLEYPNDTRGGLFLNALSKKWALVDIGAQVQTKNQHGVNTHRLQWWLVYQAGKRGLLGTGDWSGPTIGNLYAAFGSTHRSVTNVVNGNDWHLWDDIFDLQTTAYKAAKSDKGKAFGYPEWFCEWLAGKQDPKKAKTEEQAEEYRRLAKAFFDAESLGMEKALKE